MPVFRLPDEILFPDVSFAEEDGLLAVGGDLSIPRLLAAYSNGIFPWYEQGQPILWWSPDPRFVLFPDKFRMSHSLNQKLRRKVFEVKFDTDFEAVIRKCARVKRRHEDGTWITKDMVKAYTDLHQFGFAHSVECYAGGKLAGGLYGVSLGKAFFGESMFHEVTDASKVALAALVDFAVRNQFLMIDSQVETDHLISLGAELISREEYLALLGEALKGKTMRGRWLYC
jgi:leucyl/phenylalanyl-tRNA---protein transferase